MNFIGGHIRCRIGAQRRLINFLPIWNAPYTCVMGCGFQKFLMQGNHPFISGNNAAFDKRLRFRNNLRLEFVREAFNLVQPNRQSRDQRVFAGAAFYKTAHPRNGFFEHKVRRNDAIICIILNAEFHLADDAVEFFHAGDITLRAFLIFNNMGVG